MLKRSLFWWRTAVLTAILVSLTGCRSSAGDTGPSSVVPDSETLSPEERAELLQLARKTIVTYLEDRQIPPYEAGNPKFLRPGGVFVTLRKHGDLRGCIGYMQSEQPIYETIQQMAVAAATQDPRFPPVRLSEMDDITVEISLLTPMQPVHDVNDIVVGTHGLLIRQGYRQGVLLPQVAPEQGWDRQEFLQGVCLKAGLPADAWRDPSTELYSFTAEVFEEEE